MIMNAAPMRAWSRSLVLVLFAFVLLAAGPDPVSAADKLVISMTNKTDAKVYVAIARMSSGGDDARDFSKGWWGIEPGETKTLKFSYSPVCEYGFYAKSLGGKRVWAGTKDRRLGNFWVHQNAFNAHPRKSLPGGKKVSFRHLNVSERGNGATARISFTAR